MTIALIVDSDNGVLVHGFHWADLPCVTVIVLEKRQNVRTERPYSEEKRLCKCLSLSLRKDAETKHSKPVRNKLFFMRLLTKFYLSNYPIFID